MVYIRLPCVLWNSYFAALLKSEVLCDQLGVSVGPSTAYLIGAFSRWRQVS